MKLEPNTLGIDVVYSVAEAPDYNKQHPDSKPINMKKALVVCGGTEAGKATVDFQCYDENGNMLVGMLTGALIKSLARIVEQAEATHLAGNN